MSDIAVIGAGGFVGSSLIESLVLSSRQRVRAVVRSYRNMAGLCRFGSAIDLRRANAEDATSLTNALKGARSVINATTGPPAGIVRSTQVIHDACTQAGVERLIHLSSAVVYGDVPAPVGDDAPPILRHWMPYARAKGASEVWLRRHGDAGALDLVVLRPGIVWGARSPHTMDIARALAGKRAFLVDEGRGIFNGIYIANLIAAIRGCAEYPQRLAGFYNVGDDETVTWRQFFAALATPLGCDPDRLPRVSGERFPWSIGAALDTAQSLPLMNDLYHLLKTHMPDGFKTAIRARLEGDYSFQRHAHDYGAPSVSREHWHLQRVRHKLPVQKIAQVLGFRPPVSFDEGIRRTVAWLRTVGLVSPIQHPRSP